MDNIVDYKKLKEGIIASLDEFKIELETAGDSISTQALHHVLSSDIVMTYKFNQSGTLKVRNVVIYFIIIYSVLEVFL